MSVSALTAEQAANPLINPPKTKFNMPAWDKIKPEHFEPAIEWAIEKAYAQIEEIKAVSLGDANYENIIEAYEFTGQDIGRIVSVLSYYTNNAITDELVDIEVEQGAKLSEFSAKVGTDVDLYERIKKVAKSDAPMNDVQRRLTDKAFKGFEEGPLSLGAEDQKKYLELQNELSRKTAQFGKNIKNHMDPSHKYGLKVVVPKAEIATRLAGVSADALKPFTDEATGDVIIGALPESMDILEQCQNRETRKAIHTNWTGRGNIGALNNDALASDIHHLKQQQAQLFGYDTVVDATIRPDKRAAGTPDNVLNILHRIRDVAFRASKDIYDKILVEAAADGITTYDADADDVARLCPWDLAYYANIVNKKAGGIDPEEEKKYFDVPVVMEGLKRSMKRRFGLVLEETKDFKMPHEDMQVFYSKKPSGEVDGIFIVDLYQRTTKRGGAWMDQMRPAGMVDGEWQVPITLVNCNYGVDKKSQLISFDSVETLYHEFGHGAHGHFSQKTPYQSLNSINISWDAVELPSQFNEVFAGLRRHFNSYARHAETNAKMPKKLYDKLTETKPSLQLLRQNEFGMLDLELYSNPNKISSMTAFNKAAFDRTQLIANKTDNVMVNQFSHIISGGYSSGYYSYVYADFMVSAMEDLFEKHGQKAVNAFKREFVSIGCLKTASEAFDNIYRALGEPVQPLSPDGYLRKNGYGKYLDAADAEGTSGPNVPFSFDFKRP